MTLGGSLKAGLLLMIISAVLSLGNEGRSKFIILSDLWERGQ